MFVVGLLSGTLLLIGVCCVLSQMRRLWRNEPTKYDAQPEAWRGGSALWQAYRRTIPLLVLLAFPVIGGGLVMGIAGGPGNPVGEVARVVLVGASMLVLMLIPMVTAFNRPGFLVPPHLRNEPGLLHALLARRREDGT